MRMLGKLGWHGQCACCCGNDGKDQVRAQEERAWRAEAAQELAALAEEVDADA